MNKQKCRNSVLAIAAVTALAVTGCQPNGGTNADTEALKEQIAQLEQQIVALEQQAANDNAPKENTLEQAGTASDVGAQPTQDAAAGNSTQTKNDTYVGNEQTGNEKNTEQKNDTGVGTGKQSDADRDDNAQTPSDTSAGWNHASGHDEANGHNPPQFDENGGASNEQGTSIDGMTTYTMQELGSMVDAFVEKANAAVPGGTAAEVMEQFFALKQEEKQIDDLLDGHEDELEYLYKIQTLTRDGYKQLERELELLEDQLDAAEDRLEYVFGIDD